jgi:uncharacterized membrane protein
VFDLIQTCPFCPNRLILWFAASCMLKYFRFRPAACRLHLSDFGVVIQLSAGRLHAASVRLASSGSFLSRTSTSPVLSFLTVVALLFPVLPKSFISAHTVCLFVLSLLSYLAVSVFSLL